LAARYNRRVAADPARLEQMRRRFRQDPASTAFAQLAEEYRRGGRLEGAVRVCRAGLAYHPGYLSARVTLGRALMALGRDEDARAELEYVLRAAPDNLVARKGLDDILGRVAARPDPLLEALEGWLGAIVADRAARRSAAH
jgi:tetratricopeptide (TPR) repeat protein